MAAPDHFAAQGDPRPRSPQDPLDTVLDGAAVKNDGADLPWKPRAVHVSVAGNIKYVCGATTVTEAFEIGWHPIRPDRIWNTGTTATFTIWM